MRFIMALWPRHEPAEGAPTLRVLRARQERQIRGTAVGQQDQWAPEGICFQNCTICTRKTQTEGGSHRADCQSE